MPTIAEIRAQYPQYEDLSDAKLADGLYQKFYSDMPREEFNSKIGLNAAVPERTTSIADAVTDIPREIGGAFNENLGAIKSGITDRGSKGPIEGLLGTGKALLAIPGIVASPITGTARSLIGHPLAQAEHALGSLINPSVAAKDDPQKMYEAAKGDVDLSMSAMGSRGLPAPRPIPQLAPTISNDVVNAADRLGIGVPRAIASDNIAVQRLGQGIRNIPIVGDRIPRATQQLTDDLGSVVQRTADDFGQGSGSNVANRVGNVIGSAADVETQAATRAARQTDEAATAAWEAANAGRLQALDVADAQALQRSRQAVGDMSPQDMGQTIAARLRSGEQEARARKEQLYNVAGQSGGAIHADAVSGIQRDVMRNLERDGLIIDPLLTPAANRMVEELGKASKLREGGAVRSSNGVPTAKTIPTARASNVPDSSGDAPQSLLEFLSSNGGLGFDSELAAIGAHGHTVNVGGVGRRKLVKQGGLSLDYAREAAEQAGYLQGEYNKTSTVSDLLDMIDAEMRGQKRFPYGAEGSLSKRERVAMGEREQHEYDGHIRGIKEDIAASGHANLSHGIRNRVVDEMSRHRVSADDAVDSVVGELGQNDRAIYSADFSGAPVDMQDIEQTRKKLGFLSSAASNDSDRRAARHVMRGFDDWLNSAFDNALFSGSDEALQAFKDARAANADWRTRFGFNARDDADRIVNRIATGEVTPQEVSNWLVGASKVGSKGVSSRLLTRIAEATGNDPESMQAIRGGIWNRLSQSTGGVDAKAGVKSANAIYEFLNGSGRDIANRLLFGFNARDDADRIVNRIATGEVTPQEVSNWLVGASKVGSKGVSSRLLTRIAEATGNDPESMQAIRGGIWNRLSQSTGGVDAKAGVKSANAIYEFLNGSGRDIANRLFTPDQRAIMTAYADTVRNTFAQRRAAPGIERATKPTPTDVGVGPMQELANTVLGRNGKTDEALFAAINSYAKSGGRGDIQTLSRIVKALPEQHRGDLAGSIIRQIGISPRTGQFSPDVFASQWQTYTPQAKTILFGNAGPHRQALDDIMAVSERMKQIGNRFGNPSGTAQNANIFAIGAGAMAAPLTTLTAALGGSVVARILASPVTAASAAKWSKAYVAASMRPTAQTIAAYNAASQNLNNVIAGPRQDAGSSGFALPSLLSNAGRGRTIAPLGANGR